jgi:drug/metabolite transporter (DMT)-like permease
MLYLLLSAFLYALNNLLWKVNITQLDTYGLVWSRATFTFAFSCIGVFLLADPISQLKRAFLIDGWYYLIACAFGLLGLVSMIYGLKKGALAQFSLFQALMAISAGMLISIIAQINLSTFIGAGLIITAFLIHLKIYALTATNEGWAWFFIMTACFLVSGFTNWYLVKQHAPIISILAQEFIVLAVFSVYAIFRPSKVFKLYKTNALRIGSFALVIFGAIYFGTLGLQLTDPFLASITGLISPLITASFGVLVLKEKWNWKHTTSFSLITLGIVLILIS